MLKECVVAGLKLHIQKFTFSYVENIYINIHIFNNSKKCLLEPIDLILYYDLFTLLHYMALIQS